MKIVLVEYSPTWSELFEQENKMLQALLRENTATIEHIGSTSVVGLAAKPIIDIMIGLPDFSLADNLVPRIESLGYEYIPKYENVMPYRRFFTKRAQGVSTHNIHMVQIGKEFWERHILFRDYLRLNPDVAMEYAAFKKELAERDWNHSNDYAEAKTEFIRRIEAIAYKQRDSSSAT